MALAEFHAALLKDPVTLWLDLSLYRGTATIDARLALLRPVVDARLEYNQLAIYRKANGRRGRPLKAWPDFLLERLAIERVKARRAEIRETSPSISALDALEAAIRNVASTSKPYVALSTLTEWVDHPSRLHRRKRPQVRKTGL